MDAGFYKTRYPEARVVAPAAARAKVEQVIALDATAEDELPKHRIAIRPLPGWRHGRARLRDRASGRRPRAGAVRRAQQPDPPPGVIAWVMSKTTTGVKDPLAVPRIMKLAMMKDRAAARAGLARLADIPDLRFISTAHGRPVLADCAAALRAGAAAL